MFWTYEGGQFTLYQEKRENGNGKAVLMGHALCETVDGTVLDTRALDLCCESRRDGTTCLTYSCGSYRLSVYLQEDGPAASVWCSLENEEGKEVGVAGFSPIVAHGKGDEPYLFRDLRSRMLLVPYDNDMWMRYETIALRAGARSYDVTVLFQEQLHEALLLGALDFDVWKNAVCCPGTDARILEARCGKGVTGEGTHDREEHGAVWGKCVTSSAFTILFGEDWRKLLEDYAEILYKKRKPRTSACRAPFGFNCYAGLWRNCNAETFRSSGDFLKEKLMPKSFGNQGTTYINLDGGWQFLVGVENAIQYKDELHARGQMAGLYDAPFACFERDLDKPLPGYPEHTYKEILLRDSKGRLLPRVDGSLPYDLTHPVWKTWTEKKLQQYVSWGFDYLKIDFLSHGGMEGQHSDPKVTTGRQALHIGYELLDQMLDEKKLGRPFFLSLSIAPLFPYGYGNSRRFSCDAFGLTEDVEYVLNAQDYSWWTGGKLYQYNDPDHVVLYRSFCMPRPSTEGEARARYTTALICGPMFLLSDDYRIQEARERTERIATNAQINALAHEELTFRPLGQAAYLAKAPESEYLVLFSIKEQPEEICFSLREHELPEGIWHDLWTGEEYQGCNGYLKVHSDGTDAFVLKCKK